MSDSAYATLHLQADWDLCGFGTKWGCKREILIGDRPHLLVNGRKPTPSPGGGPHCDDGNVLFHRECSPAVVAPETVQRWAGSYTGRQRERAG